MSYLRVPGEPRQWVDSMSVLGRVTSVGAMQGSTLIHLSEPSLQVGSHSVEWADL